MQEQAWMLRRMESLGLVTDDQLIAGRTELGLEAPDGPEAQSASLLTWLVARGHLREATLEAIRQEGCRVREHEPAPELAPYEPYGTTLPLPGPTGAGPTAALEADQPTAQASPGADGLPLPPVPRTQVYPAPEWDRYEPLAFLGAGAMGAVYKAYDPSLQRIVALKFLFNHHAKEASDRETRSFFQEARTQARVDHPNVAKVYQVGEVEGSLYLALQFIEGAPLSHLHARHSLADKVAIIAGVALGLQAVHRLGVVHQDIKPSNIMVTQDESGGFRGMLTDFGVAFMLDQENLSRHGVIAGTPAYMSPEQARGEAIDARGDVYSLGATLYEFLSGRLPIPIGRDLLGRIQTEVPASLGKADPGFPEDLQAILGKCLEKQPADRYESAQALAQDLQAFLQQRPVQARPSTFGYRGRLWVARNRALAALAVLLATTVLAGSLIVTWEWARSRAQAGYAIQFSQEVEGLEASLTQIRTLPAHDAGQDFRRILHQLAGMEKEINLAGRPARGPGHAALGQAFLALRDWDTARSHFQRAVDYGYAPARVRTGLGLAMTAVYYDKSRALAFLPDGIRKARGRELQVTLARPALAFLKQNPHPGAEGDLIHAQILASEGRLPQALAFIDKSMDRSPWRLETRRLQCELRVEDWEGRAEGPGDERLAEDLAALEALLARGSEQARSDAYFPAARCRLQLASLTRQDSQMGLSEAHLQTLLAMVRQARSLDSQAPELDRVEAHAYLLHAKLQMHRALDNGATCAAVLKITGRALADHPALEWAHLFSVQAQALRADYLSTPGLGLDPTPAVDATLKAVDGYRRCAPDQAARLDYYSAEALSSLALFLQESGLDARATLDKGLVRAGYALKALPDWPDLEYLKATLLALRGESEADPRPWYKQAESLRRECLRTSPGDARQHWGLAILLNDWLTWECDTLGTDPRPRIAEVNRELDLIHRLAPGMDEKGAQLRLNAQRTGLSWLVGQGEPCQAIQEQVQADTEALPPHRQARPRAILSFIKASQALWADRSPLPALKAAEAVLPACGRSGDPEVLTFSGRISLDRALWHMGQKEPFQEDLETARKTFSRTLKMKDPYWGSEALLQLILADLLESAAHPQGDAQSLARADENLRRARALTPQPMELGLFQTLLDALRPQALPRKAKLSPESREKLKAIAAGAGNLKAETLWIISLLGRLGG